MCAAPTDHEPGSTAKIAVMVARYEHGLPLFLSGDFVRDDDVRASSFVEVDEVE